MSIAYLDPGNIESDLQQGAVAEYKVHALDYFLIDISMVFSVIDFWSRAVVNM